MSVKHILIAQDGAVMCTKKALAVIGLCFFSVPFSRWHRAWTGMSWILFNSSIWANVEQIQSNDFRKMFFTTEIPLIHQISSPKKRTNWPEEPSSHHPQNEIRKLIWSMPSKPPFFFGVFNRRWTARLDYNPWRRPRWELWIRWDSREMDHWNEHMIIHNIFIDTYINE